MIQCKYKLTFFLSLSLSEFLYIFELLFHRQNLADGFMNTWVYIEFQIIIFFQIFIFSFDSVHFPILSVELDGNFGRLQSYILCNTNIMFKHQNDHFRSSDKIWPEWKMKENKIRFENKTCCFTNNITMIITMLIFLEKILFFLLNFEYFSSNWSHLLAVTKV